MSPRVEDAARQRGRRPGGPDTRAAIVDAARSSFAAKGYDKASLRGIARDAGVDPALVHHYFDGKAALFAETMAVPVNPSELIERVLDGDRERLGWRLVDTFLTVWEPPERRDGLVALVRSSLTSEEAARMLREFLGREVFGRIASSTGAADPQLSGVSRRLADDRPGDRALCRARARGGDREPAELIDRLGPVLQGYLVDEPRRPE